MGKRSRSKLSQKRLESYLDDLGQAVGHADRREPLRAYLQGLLLPGERKSVEPMAAKVDPRNVASRHQSMHHFVAKAPWDGEALLDVAREWALPRFEKHGGIKAWIVDDTGIPKKGKHSVGVARQYCGILGKQDNCQVAVSISVANESLSLPVRYRLYLPEEWASDPDRRDKAGVPEEVTFQKKWEIALNEIDALQNSRVPEAPVVMDAGYGNVTAFREALTARGLLYVAAIQKDVRVWLPGETPKRPQRNTVGRPRKLLRRDEGKVPISVRDLAQSLPGSAWKSVSWRQGTKQVLRSRFARLRVHPSHRDYWRGEPHAEEWLLIEWPEGEEAPTHYWLSTLSKRTALRELARLTKIRWRIERDYQELKSELGLDHYEGRGWLGFHHHAALCIAAYAFLVAEQARLFPPDQRTGFPVPSIPKGFRPRGSPGPNGAT